ncbi:hypothetical protein HYX10_05315 [Candidatus Woesearchaeota archaeon]|nr:hypothetical protein [Candidatus Woesearchaeota archaeon]
MDPLQLIVKSLKDFRHNLIIVVPTLIALGLFALLALFAVAQFALGYQLFEPDMSAGLILYAGFFILLDVALLIIISTYYGAAQNGVMADIVNKGNSSFSKLLDHGKTYFMPLLTFTIAKFIILLLPVLVLGILAVPIYLLSVPAGIAVTVLFALIYIMFLIAFSVLTVFNLPILISKKIYGFRVIIESFRYGKENLTHTLVTAAMVAAIWVVTMIIYSIIGLPATLIDMAESFGFETNIALTIVYVMSNLLAMIASFIGGLIISLFVFNSYFHKNKVRK